MTISEHNTHHKKSKKMSDKARMNISKGARKPKTEV